jgi:hypothetical protein
MTLTMKITVFWDVAPCSLVDKSRVSKEPVSFVSRVDYFYPEEGGSMLLRNVRHPPIGLHGVVT